jgi:diguanylate cyclase (GGDEF)-like protein
VDCFKAYNDHYGHQEGDRVLKQVAHALRSNLHRATDYIARYGGEEFSIILLDTPNENGAGVAESLRAAVESLNIENAVSTCAGVVTVSVGVATAGDNGPVSEATLVLYADKALYLAKETGRNRVCSQNVPAPSGRPGEHKRARA